jgi:hypothetical protein
MPVMPAASEERNEIGLSRRRRKSLALNIGNLAGGGVKRSESEMKREKKASIFSGEKPTEKRKLKLIIEENTGAENQCRSGKAVKMALMK